MCELVFSCIAKQPQIKFHLPTFTIVNIPQLSFSLSNFWEDVEHRLTYWYAKRVYAKVGISASESNTSGHRKDARV